MYYVIIHNYYTFNTLTIDQIAIMAIKGQSLTRELKHDLFCIALTHTMKTNKKCCRCAQKRNDSG